MATFEGITPTRKKKNGKTLYIVRLKHREPGQTDPWDTDRRVWADGMADAAAQQERLLAEFVAKKRKSIGANHSAASETIRGLTSGWLATLRYSTRTTYASYMRRFVAAFGDCAPSDLSTMEIQRFIAGLPVSDQSAACYRNGIISLFRWAKAEGRIAANPALDTERRKTELTDEEHLAAVSGALPPKKTMTEEELAAFFQRFEQTDPEAFLIIGSQLLLGCRIGEALALHWDSLGEDGSVLIRHNFVRGRLTVPKNKKVRYAAFTPAWIARLRAHQTRLRAEGRAGCEDICFPAPPEHIARRASEGLTYFWRYEGIWRRFRRALDICGIALAPKTATHTLRHTLISLVRQENAAVVADRFLGLAGVHVADDPGLRARVGHSSIKTTDGYTHIAPVHFVNFAAKVEQKVAAAVGGPFGGDRARPESIDK